MLTKTVAISVCLLLVSCHGLDEPLHPYCPAASPCYIDSDGTAQLLTYDGEVCGPGTLQCSTTGAWSCPNFTGNCPVVEEPPPSPCHNGDSRSYYPDSQYPGTDGFGNCTPGIDQCINGKWEHIKDATTPGPARCNLQDNNCDNIPDQYEIGASVKAAFVFLIDFSGSMADHPGSANDAVNAACDWATQSRFQESKFAMVAVAFSQYDASPYLNRWADFSTGSDLCSSMADHMTGYSAYDSGGEEYIVPAAIELHEDSPIKLAWPAGLDQYVLAFTDERPHTLSGTDDQASYDDMANSLQLDCTGTHPYTFDVFTLPDDSIYAYEFDMQGDTTNWEEFTSLCGGTVEPLDNEYSMVDTLDSMFLGGCVQQ